MATELARRIRGTRPMLAAQLRARFLDNTINRDFEALVLLDLNKGDRFIPMPMPGDNSGHGGLLGGHHLFMKTDLIANGDLSMNVVRLSDGSSFYFKDDFLVIKID